MVTFNFTGMFPNLYCSWLPLILPECFLTYSDIFFQSCWLANGEFEKLILLRHFPVKNLIVRITQTWNLLGSANLSLKSLGILTPF